ncbi:GNAT family N-acetyltransferase [Pelagovum pacificum]|uniref:L-ornithine N(alpha)-acyltransferase n=1 Tax=Pelagovum pacificum TaxID=2588711 RepID=A0A5C5GCJ8_9RHOB|nr:GNAT family N-acyltransferase [Pelagovum pacificum]QQA44660.1 GNAT family N-acetyltransferase [Pelagovum pacificum]TNY32230.1 GNAT family N-acetyltransferase [Pelagovum pacificum]
MSVTEPVFQLRLADGPADLEAVQRLRYEVFVEELGGTGALVDHERRLERDAFDSHARHLMVVDETAGGRVVGVYRLMDREDAARAGGFYSESEYDLSPLIDGGRRLLELGRSCLHRDYRGGAAMYHLWTGLAEHVAQTGAEVLFGVASFHGTDVDALAQPLSLLHHRHLAPEASRVRARGAEAVAMDLLPEDQIDRRAALLQIPALIKAYLRLGGTVGQGAWVDRAFNTTDVCLVMDTARMNDKQTRLYTRESAK